MTSVAEFLASVNPNDLVLRVGPLAIYRLELSDGSRVAAGVTDPNLSLEGRTALVRGLTTLHELALGEGFLEIAGVDPEGRGFLARPIPTGCARDLKVLSWPLAKRIEFFRTVAELVRKLHAKNITHGTLSPEHVLLRESLEPVLLGPGVADPRAGLYTSPEVKAGAPGGQRSDIYTLGRFLEFVVREEDPEPATGPMLLLGKMSQAPAGLTRIVRKCTVQDPEHRYANVGELLFDLGRYGQYTEVGLAHPDANEENLTGIALSERPSRRPPGASAVPAPAVPARGSRVSGLATKKSVKPSFGPVLTPEERLAARRTKQIRTIGACLVLGVLVALYHLVPYVQLSLLRGKLASSNPAEQKEGLLGIMERDKNLRGYNLRGFDFRELTLAGASFVGSDLRDADFSGCDLAYVNFAEAQLGGANFGGADLRSARLAAAEGADEALCDRETELPGGWSCIDERLAPADVEGGTKGLRGPR